jgi:hypothetical protein
VLSNAAETVVPAQKPFANFVHAERAAAESI